jgi:hypothetical protein
MNIGEIFSDSFKYPFSDIKKFAIFGILVVLATINLSIANSSILQVIFNIISFVAIILVLGYGLNVVKCGFEKVNELPSLNFKTDFVNGLKLFVLQCCYYIVPLILVYITAYCSGFLQALVDVANTYLETGVYSFSNVFLTSMTITIIVAIVLFIVFALFSNIGMARLAKYGDIFEGINISKVVKDLKKIGISKTIGWLIVLVIVGFILILVGIGISMIIPVVGSVIASFIVISYLYLFYYRCVGLLYSNI